MTSPLRRKHGGAPFVKYPAPALAFHGPAVLRRAVARSPRLKRHAVGALTWLAYTALPPLRLRALIWRKQLYRVLDAREDRETLRVNLGGGAYFRRHWRVLDMPSPTYGDWRGIVDDVHDLASFTPLPYTNGSVWSFYSSHVLEHIPQAFCLHLFRELYRCLRRGGLVRLTMPDFEHAADAYREQKWAFFAPWPGDTPEDRFLHVFASSIAGTTRARAVPEHFARLSPEAFADLYTSFIDLEQHRQHPGKHVNWWTHEKCQAMLREAGFTKVWRSSPQQSAQRAMQGSGRWSGFDSTYPEVSLFVEASR